MSPLAPWPRPSRRAVRWGFACALLAACGDSGGGAPSDADLDAELDEAALPWDAGPRDARIWQDRRPQPPPPDQGPPPPGSCAGEIDLLAEAVATEDAWTWRGDTRGAPQRDYGSCGGNGRELAFRFTAPEAGEYRFTTATDDPSLPGFDTLLYARETCADPVTELACDNDPTGIVSTVTVPMVEGGTVHVFVDGYARNQGGEVALRVFLRRPAGDGEPCDPDDGETACAEGLRCMAREARPFCRRLTAPVLSDGALAFNAELGALGLRVSGSDPEDDVLAVLLTLLDADGGPIPLGLGPGPFLLPFDTVDAAGGTFEGALSLRLPADLPAVTHATVAVLDSTDLVSATLELDATAPLVRAPGEPCDAARAFDTCAEGALCDDGLCAEVEKACPPDLRSRELPLGETVEADLTGATDLGRGQCGGAAGEQLWALTAEDAGLYVVEAWADGVAASPLLFARTHCAVEDALVELGCGLVGTNGRARVAFELEASQTAHVFVGTSDAAWAGPYRLRGWQPAPPTLDAAEVFANEAGRVLGFALAGRDPDEDVVAFSVRLLDGDGMDLLGEAVDLRVKEGELDIPRPGRLEIRASRLLDLDVSRIARLDVALVDAVGGRSPVRTVTPAPTPVVGRGEACDPDEAFADCARGSRCDAELGECIEVRHECPADYGEVIELSHPVLRLDERTWRYDGDTTLGANLTAGSCGGFGASEVSHRFRAPSGGRYRFRTQVEAGRDTLLYVRRDCGEETADSEMACNDDAGAGELGSAVLVVLEAGEEVFAIVDGVFGDGRYTLFAEALP